MQAPNDNKNKKKSPENKKKRFATFSPGSDGPTTSKTLRNKTDLSGTIFKTPNQFTSTPVIPPPGGSGQEEERSNFEDSVSEVMQTSMKEIPKNSNVYSSPSIEFVIIDVFKKNGIDFHGNLPRESLRFFWTNLGRNLEEVKILSCDRNAGRHLRITANLRRGLTLSIAEVTNSYESQIEVPSASASGAAIDVYSIRFPQFKDLVCELGQEITVTFKSVPPEVSCTDLRNWLSLFGEAMGSFRY
jgi:hypothetical protein